MLTITAEIAQAVLDALAPDLPHPINIMDDMGRIVASTNPERIGQLHPGAQLALESREAVVVETDGPSQRRGANLPIMVEGRPIGVVGITGPPDDVVPVARLVRRTVTMALEQRALQREQSDRQRRRDLLVERLISHEGDYPKALLERARDFGLDLDRPHTAVLIVGPGTGPSPSRTRGIFPLAPVIDGFLAEGEQSLGLGIAAVRSARPTARLAVGPSEIEVARSLKLAGEAWAVASRLGMPDPTVHYRDLAVLCSLARAHRGTSADSLRDHPELTETLCALVRENADLQATASALHIHRNTLTYRIGRIEALSGLDPRRPLALVQLVAELLGRLDADGERPAS